jgi:type I restriction enzyme S subunit
MTNNRLSWVTKTIGDFVSVKRGYDLTSKQRKAGKIPVYGAAGQNGVHNELKAKAPGIVIGRSGGSFGKVHFVPEDFWPHNTAMYVTDFKGNDPYFTYYLLKLLDFSALNSGSAQPSLNRNYLYPVEIKTPTSSVQKIIGEVLKNLDEKIEINNKINQELEAMAKLIYDYWFVQFDFPDANGKPYKSSGGKMTYNDELKRKVPEGWKSDYVENLLAKETRTAKLPKTEYKIEGRIPVIDQSTKYIIGYTNELSTLITTEVPRIVFGDHTRILKLVNFDFARGADGTQVLLSKNKCVPQHFFYHSLLKIDLSNYGYARHFKFLKQTRTIIPNEDVVTLFEDKMISFYSQIKHNIFETNELTELRDWLLPMLMNGQVTVKDV